jgi:hypothetical protein
MVDFSIDPLDLDFDAGAIDNNLTSTMKSLDGRLLLQEEKIR